MVLADKIQAITEEAIQGTTFFVVDILVTTFRSNTRVAIFLDGDNGIGIDDCAEISRKIDDVIEAENLIEKGYTLEVSSPGLDKPLKHKRQYQRNVGRKLKLLMNDKSEKTGTLLGVTDNGINLMEEIKEKKLKTEKEVNIPFDQINKANIIVVFK